jgi:hypothetical protein
MTRSAQQLKNLPAGQQVGQVPALGLGVGETPQTEVVRISLATRWVDLQWLAGRLHSYRTASRWEVLYTT